MPGFNSFITMLRCHFLWLSCLIICDYQICDPAFKFVIYDFYQFLENSQTLSLQVCSRSSFISGISITHMLDLLALPLSLLAYLLCFPNFCLYTVFLNNFFSGVLQFYICSSSISNLPLTSSTKYKILVIIFFQFYNFYESLKK